jgi:hypothetical protein
MCCWQPLHRPLNSCEIHWKPGKDLTHETVTKKVGKGKGKNKKSVTKVEPCPSFFRFFESIEFDEAKARDMEQDEVMAVRARDLIDTVVVCTVCNPYLFDVFLLLLFQIYQQMQAEADVGFALKNKIVPNAVHWFTGEVCLRTRISLWVLLDLRPIFLPTPST